MHRQTGYRIAKINIAVKYQNKLDKFRSKSWSSSLKEDCFSISRIRCVRAGRRWTQLQSAGCAASCHSATGDTKQNCENIQTSKWISWFRNLFERCWMLIVRSVVIWMANFAVKHLRAMRTARDIYLWGHSSWFGSTFPELTSPSPKNLNR